MTLRRGMLAFALAALAACGIKGDPEPVDAAPAAQEVNASLNPQGISF